jgi:diguanylate cyclase (GGDEF)-like protein
MALLLERRDGERRNAEAKLQHQALNDELTGLPNRRLLRDRLAQTMAAAKRQGSLGAMLYIDLDDFKLVNDSLGHSIGDILLSQVATRLRSRIRASDTLARLGGDEFTIVMARVAGREEAGRVAQQLLDILAAPFLIEDHKITISASVGVSIFPEDAEDPAVLFQQADSAMYAAKNNGRNGVRCYTPEVGSSVRERMNLQNQLRGAIDRGEISVEYQPEFDIPSHRLVRFEALARWTHPTLGTIPPAKFIPIAEEDGMIVSLGAYILERACVEAMAWQKITPYPIQVAVNVSSVQFGRDTFVDEVMEVLNRTGLKPDLLQLELTESVMLNGVSRPAEMMKRLSAIGISLAIDDFGMGYSCLSYLPSLPFDALKIDRAFVNELDKPAARAMIYSLVTLARNLDMRVIIEGVEKQEQMEFIRKLGAHEVQGYLLGGPTPDPAFQLTRLVQEDRWATWGEEKSGDRSGWSTRTVAVNGALVLPAQ